MPNQNQFAPTNSFVSIKLNNNAESVVAVGNHYPVEVETGRYDAHIGNVININKNLKVKNLETSLFTSKDARSINKITINNKVHVMVSNNRDNIEFFKVTN